MLVTFIPLFCPPPRMQVGPENDGRSHQPSGEFCADAIKQNLERMWTTQRSHEMSHFQQKAVGDDNTSA